MPSFEDLRHVPAADVYKSGRHAGTLRRVRGAVEFRYEDAYLADLAAPAVARTLPRTATPVTTPGGAVAPFFAGLLPEGIRLRAVVTGTRTSEDDHLTLLLAVGEDAVGDVQVVEAGALPSDPVPHEAPEVPAMIRDRLAGLRGDPR